MSFRRLKFVESKVFHWEDIRITPQTNFSRDRNFIAILKSFAEIGTVLHDHLENGPKNAQIKSWKIQNEIIACIAEVIRRHIRLTLNNTKYFCLIVD